MSPHLYIAYILICVKWSVCYEYYERESAPRGAKNVPEIKNQGRNARLGKSPNAQFDLADFLNAEALGDSNYDYNVKSEHNSKDYNDYGSIDSSVDNIKKRDDNSEFLNFNGAYSQGESNVNPSEVKNPVNGRQYNLAGLSANEKVVNNRDEKAVTVKLQDESVERKLSHHPEKKCSFKKMKFPFFSHNKSQTTKKAKKRKMFCLNCKKDDAVTSSTEPFEIRNKNKRSYVEKLCPECQRKFRAEVKDDEKKILNRRMIHNSRQYYAAINQPAENRWNEKESSTDIAFSIQHSRRKRDHYDDNDRRLQELDLIQKKVDNVEVTMPRFEKPVRM